MQGWQKIAGVVHQCPRCFTLRDPANERPECRTCLRLLGVVTTQTIALPLADVSSDESPVDTVEEFILMLMATPNPPCC